MHPSDVGSACPALVPVAAPATAAPLPALAALPLPRSTGVRLVCTNQVGNGARTTVVSTQSGRTVR